MKIKLKDFRGREKRKKIISISWVMNIPLNMCHVGPRTIYIDFMGHENSKKSVQTKIKINFLKRLTKIKIIIFLQTSS